MEHQFSNNPIWEIGKNLFGGGDTRLKTNKCLQPDPQMTFAHNSNRILNYTDFNHDMLKMQIQYERQTRLNQRNLNDRAAQSLQMGAPHDKSSKGPGPQ